MPVKRKATKKDPRSKNAKGGVARSASSANAIKSRENSSCPIVGIGGSAGGFEAAMELLRPLSPKTGMAFVIVQHLDPHHASRLASLLAKVTTMPVIEITKTTRPQRDTVYVQPANKCVVVKDGQLALVRRTERLNLAIDHFFESLADGCGSQAIGVVLSGTGSDGTAGLRAIKAAGGMTFAQDDRSAKFPDMPRSAIRSGFVDTVLSPREMAKEIERMATHPYFERGLDAAAAELAKSKYEESDALGRIFLSLKTETGVDFKTYKQSTLLRRIQRRMTLHRLRGLDAYAKFLRNNKKEIESLFDDLLINVTRFFRDKAVFRALQKRFLPALLKKKKDNRRADLRVWVPGCASGEEVYSLAICILEALGKGRSWIRVQFFGTDLSEVAIDRARLGIYSSAIEKDVTPARLRRFFVKRDSAYRISREVRDLCTFARQNITADPPFSRLDLISCRNVLIYLGAELHKRCIPQFHYALNPGGYLILGPAESVGTFEGLFQLADRKNKIYVKRNVPPAGLFDLVAYSEGGFRRAEPRLLEENSAALATNLLQMADRIVLNSYAPAAVVIDEEMRVQQFRGRTELYLQHMPGPATLNLLQLVRPSLIGDLRTTIRRALKSGEPVRKDRAAVKIDGKLYEVNIQVVPFKLPDSDRVWYLTIFDERTKGAKPPELARVATRKPPQREIADLRRELAATKESLQAIIEEQEATNEELKSANEEIESSNEELQSTNEELETAKEELQSTNEELTTLNEELANRNFEMMEINSDLGNLLASIQLPIVMVDNKLTVRRATPAARHAFNVIQSDIGRPLRDLRPNVDIPDLEKMLREVIETLSSVERVVRDDKGRVYSLRVRPYRTTDDKIDGAVLTLVDINGGKSADGERGKKGKIGKA